MAKDLTTTEYEPIRPEGLALSLLNVTIVFTILSSVVAALRFYIRISLHAFSVEDWLMLVGWIINLGHNAAVIFLYVLDGAIIKSSIIWTILRLAKNLNRIYTNILWALFALCWIVWQISWPVAIFQCKPVSAAWGEPGDCTSGQTVILNVSYFVSAANIFTDIGTTLVPIFLLRHLQMPKKKFLTMGILSLVVECDLGIIAGSMPMLRCFFRNLVPSYGASDGTPGRSPDVNLVTIGGTNGRRARIKLSNIGSSRADGDQDHHFQDKESNGDDESTRQIIHITREVEQDSVSGRGLPANQFQVAVSGSSRPGQNSDLPVSTRSWGRQI
ncbi:hypothetical protein DL762_000096 [Monosporascus cannonballus]|uniref:Rhodopsin domain-containing protein n=1 Tax=Monosporascus cannonballus TaxID=155416 RepID=A0ABY0HNT3_9PEZI|nr:hypothetical protein DL762_000096 [Monosporascus cannonballus]